VKKPTWNGTHTRFDPENEQIISVETPATRDAKEQTEASPFLFSSPVLVKTDVSSEDAEEQQEDFQDENDENRDPESEDEEERPTESDLWSLREPKKEPKWCGSHVFFSSSSDEENADDDVEVETQDDQMDFIEKNFSALTADN